LTPAVVNRQLTGSVVVRFLATDSGDVRVLRPTSVVLVPREDPLPGRRVAVEGVSHSTLIAYFLSGPEAI